MASTPGEERRAAKAEAAAVEIAKGQTFEAVARERHRKKGPGSTPCYAIQVIQKLGMRHLPGAWPPTITELRAPDFLAVPRKTEARG